MSLKDSVTLPKDLLTGLDTARLQEIADNEAKFVEFFSGLELDDIKRINNERDAVTATNRELALEIMNKKPEYEEKKTRLVDTSLMAAEFKLAYDQKYKQLKNLSSSANQSAVLNDLQEGAKTAEREAEDLADTFMEGQSDLSSDEFIKQFMSHRQTYWLRRVKAEKMDELLKQPAPYPPSNPVSSMPVPVPRPRPRQHSLTPTPTQPSSSMPPKQNSLQSSSLGANPPPYASLQPQQAIPTPTQSYYSPSGGMPMPRSPHRPAPAPPTQPRPSYPPTSNYQYNNPPAVGQPTASLSYYPQQRPPQPYPPPQQQYPPPQPQYGGYQRR